MYFYGSVDAALVTPLDIFHCSYLHYTYTSIYNAMTDVEISTVLEATNNGQEV